MKPKSCSGCPLERLGAGFVQPDGSGLNGILIVGEAPGRDEAAAGKPFIGASGFFLDRILRRAGLPRDQFRVANTINCRPPGNILTGAHYSAGAVAHCAPNLDEEIARFKPKVIIALGAVALQRLTGFSQIRRARGYILEGPHGIPVIGTFHPAFLMPRKDRAEGKDKNPWRLIGLTILDFKKAARLAAGQLPDAPPLRYLCDPPPFGLDQFIVDYEAAGYPPLSYDIETPGKLVESDEDELEGDSESAAILRIGFCFTPGYSISVPWRGDYLPGIRRLLESPGDKVGWNNYGFDDIRVRKEGICLGGRSYDAMWGWHSLQSDLPRGLEVVAGVYADGLKPWKHLADAEPARYNAQDADAQLRNFLGIRSDLQALGLWEVHEQHVVELWPVLRRATVTGVPIDQEAQGILRAQLTAEAEKISAQAQSLAPLEVRARKRYKRQPIVETDADALRFYEEVLVPGERKFCTACNAEVSNKTEHFKGGKKKNPCKAAGATLEKRSTIVTEWDEILPFNPLGDDLERYIRWAGHPMGSHARTGRETIDKKHLDKLIKRYGEKHPIYPLTKEMRDVQKILGTFLYSPGVDGRIHAEYSLAPSSHRLSQRNPNLQNVAHGERDDSNPFADAVRRTIVPPRGFVFVEADSSAIEAVMSGYFMADSLYMDLATKGIHDYVTCLELGLEFEPAKVKVYRKELHGYESARSRNKRVVHGTNYGMSPKLMAKIYPETFKNELEARVAQERYFAACPALPAWHHETRLAAHRQCYLQNPWGYRHYFWHVFSKNAKGKLTLGEDGKRCIAFLPQSSAAAFMRENAILIAQSVESDWQIPANFLVHDSYCLIVPESDKEEAAIRLRTILLRPIPQMGNLTIGCEVKWGRNWCDMESFPKQKIELRQVPA